MRCGAIWELTADPVRGRAPVTSSLWSGRAGRAQTLIYILGQKSSAETIALFLLSLVPTHGRDAPQADVPLPLSRREMSELLGLTVETVSRLMAKLERERIIEAPRGRFRILNRPGLNIYAGTTRSTPARRWRAAGPSRLVCRADGQARGSESAALCTTRERSTRIRSEPPQRTQNFFDRAVIPPGFSPIQAAPKTLDPDQRRRWSPPRKMTPTEAESGPRRFVTGRCPMRETAKELTRR